MQKCVRNGKPDILGYHKCHNRADFIEFVSVKDGFTEDGRQKFRDIPFVMSNECKWEERKTSERCMFCKWR